MRVSCPDCGGHRRVSRTSWVCVKCGSVYPVFGHDLEVAYRQSIGF